MKLQAGIRTKLLAIVALTAVILTVAGAVALDFIYSQMIADRTTMVKAINDTAVAEAVQLQHQVDAGTMTRDQAIAALREILHTMRFGEGSKDYIFAYFMDGVSLANVGNTSIEGQNLIGKTTPNGQHVIAGFRRWREGAWRRDADLSLAASGNERPVRGGAQAGLL